VSKKSSLFGRRGDGYRVECLYFAASVHRIPSFVDCPAAVASSSSLRPAPVFVSECVKAAVVGTRLFSKHPEVSSLQLLVEQHFAQIETEEYLELRCLLHWGFDQRGWMGCEWQEDCSEEDVLSRAFTARHLGERFTRRSGSLFCAWQGLSNLHSTPFHLFSTLSSPSLSGVRCVVSSNRRLHYSSTSPTIIQHAASPGFKLSNTTKQTSPNRASLILTPVQTLHHEYLLLQKERTSVKWSFSLKNPGLPFLPMVCFSASRIDEHQGVRVSDRTIKKKRKQSRTTNYRW